MPSNHLILCPCSKKKKNPQFWRTTSWNDGCGKAFIPCVPIIHIYSLPCLLLTKISINIPILWMRRLNLREVTWPKCSHSVSIRARSMKPGLWSQVYAKPPSCHWPAFLWPLHPRPSRAHVQNQTHSSISYVFSGSFLSLGERKNFTWRKHVHWERNTDLWHLIFLISWFHLSFVPASTFHKPALLPKVPGREASSTQIHRQIQENILTTPLPVQVSPTRTFSDENPCPCLLEKSGASD